MWSREKITRKSLSCTGNATVGAVANPPLQPGPQKVASAEVGWGAFCKIRNIARSLSGSFDPVRDMLWDHGPVETDRVSGLRPVSGGPCRASEPVGGGMLERDSFPV